MKIHLLVVGKTTATYISDAVDEYCRRLKHYITFDMEVIPELKECQKLEF